MTWQPKSEREHRATLDLIVVGAERPEQLPQIRRLSTCRRRTAAGCVVTRPLADGQIDR
jgi:hypothetical protein